MIYLFETDLRGIISNHIVVFSHADYWMALTDAIRFYSDQLILFISSESQDTKWSQMKKIHKNICYCQSSLHNVDELKRAAIEESY
jgi:hypothetical protein